MRLHEITLNESGLEDEKWWYNVTTREVLPVPRSHGDMVEADPGRFGVPPEKVAELQARYPDDGELATWWEYVRYEAQLKGWVRIGRWHDGDDAPYIYAASLKQARTALQWMLSQAIVIDKVNVEITNSREPVEGSGDFYQFKDERAVKLFLRTGKTP